MSGCDVAIALLPEGAEIFFDARGDARALRVRWHEEAGLVTLSLWRGEDCVSTFRLPIAQVPELVAALQAGLHDPA